MEPSDETLSRELAAKKLKAALVHAIAEKFIVYAVVHGYADELFDLLKSPPPTARGEMTDETFNRINTLFVEMVQKVHAHLRETHNKQETLVQ